MLQTVFAHQGHPGSANTTALATRPVRPWAALALAGLLLAASTAAQAGFNPDPSVYDNIPLYRSLAFGGIDRDGDGGILSSDLSLSDYADNVSYLPFGSANGNFSANGANMSVVAWTSYSGQLASRNYASMTISNANVNDAYRVTAGQGSATRVSFSSQQAAAASASFTFRVTGTEFNPLNAGLSTSRLDFAATTDTSKTFNNLFDGSLGTPRYGPGTYTYNLPTLALGTPINLLFWSSAFTQINKGQVPQGSTFNMTADYGHTFVLEDVQLFDANNNKLSDWTLIDNVSNELLFDQSGRIAEVLAVPEPGSWAMLLAGLAVTAALVKRRRV